MTMHPGHVLGLGRKSLRHIAAQHITGIGRDHPLRKQHQPQHQAGNPAVRVR